MTPRKTARTASRSRGTTVASRPRRSRKGLSGRRRVRKPKPRRCMICGSTELLAGLDLGHQPVGDLILSEAELNEPETFYPMQVFQCAECGLSQLGYTVDPAVVYKNFPFVSGTTRTATRHLQSLAKKLVRMLDLGPRDLAVDIGSNDGTLLEGYARSKATILGVDPSGDPVRIANEKGIRTWHAFFDEDTAARARRELERAKAITACGCFAHIADLDGVMRGVDALLHKDGVFATDNQYWLDMVERLHYDNVFHQHLRNYSLEPYQALMAQYGLEVFDVERSEVYGGSIRFFACRAGRYPIHRRVRRLEAEEAKAKLYEPKTLAAWTRKIEKKRDKLFDAVYSRVKKGQKVIGLGAPAKASTVMNYCGLDRRLVEYVTEINPLRIGFHVPGVHVPIVDEQWMFDDPRPADAGILFAWNYHDEVVPKLRAKGWKGKVLLP